MTRRTYLRCLLPALVLLIMGIGAPFGTVSAVEKIEPEIDGCTSTGSGDTECSFDCSKLGVYSILQITVELTGSGDGEIKATCGGSEVADCSGAPCEGSGTAGNGSSNGKCIATGDYDKAICRAVVWQPDVDTDDFNID